MSRRSPSKPACRADAADGGASRSPTSPRMLTMPVEAELALKTPLGPDGGSTTAAAAAAAADVAEEPQECACVHDSLEGPAGNVAGGRGVVPRQCLPSFVGRITRSAALYSALLSLELSGSHPLPGGADCSETAGLESTLAQLLALHRRAGVAEGEPASETDSHSCNPLGCGCLHMFVSVGGWVSGAREGEGFWGCYKAMAPPACPAWCPAASPKAPGSPAACRSCCAATGASLLAALWLLQSLDSCQWSDASACLSSWFHYLAAFNPMVRAKIPLRAWRRSKADLPATTRVQAPPWLSSTQGACAPLRRTAQSLSLPRWCPQLVQQLTADWDASFVCLRSNLVAAQVGHPSLPAAALAGAQKGIGCPLLGVLKGATAT